MPPKRRSKRKRREKRLERLPEKLQRRRERRVTYRIRRMPSWIKGALVIAVIAVIVVGASVGIGSLYPPQLEDQVLGDVYFLQQDIFYLKVDSDSNLILDSMDARFGIGYRGSEEPLNFSLTDTFDENHNITLENAVIWDYFGNAYLLDSTIESRSINFTFDEIWPPINITRELEGTLEGYWSLFFGYTLDSANDEGIRTDNLDDFITGFNCTIQPENGKLDFNTSTIVLCNITLNTRPDPAISYCYGRARLEFPKQVYNSSTLLANISLHQVIMTGTETSPDTDYSDGEDFISFDTDFTFMSEDTWGFIFELNVTTFTNNSFCLLDFSTEQCEFYIQAGYQEAPYNPDQPMHFPQANLDIGPLFNHTIIANFTDINIRLPQIWVEVNSTPSTPTQILQLQASKAMHTPQYHRLPSPGEIEKQPRHQTYHVDTEVLFEPLALTAPKPILAYLRRPMLF